MALELRGLSLSVGSARLLEGATARACEGQRVALVGRNGSGKSTLLRAIAGGLGSGDGVAPRELLPSSSSSSSSSSPYFTVGAGSVGGTAASALFVGQDAPRWGDLLLLPYGASEEEDDLLRMPVSDALDVAACYALEAAELAEAWRDLCSRADSALGWGVARYGTTPLGELSPGSAKRAYLALALLRPGAGVLLLDEPTNHLDLPSVLWLQHAILASGKTVVTVSHDAEFLDAVADHVWEIDDQEAALVASASTYSAFRHARQLAREQQRAAYEAQQERHQRVSAAASALRASSARGSRYAGTDNDKMQRDFKRDRAGRSAHKAKAMEASLNEPLLERPKEARPLHIVLEPLGSGADTAMVLDECTLGYGGVALPVPPISLRIDAGDRVAIVGLNGVGKSSVLRTLSREVAPIDGEARVGRELRLGNLTQEHETLPRDRTPREHMVALMGGEVSAFDAGQELIRHGLTLRQVDCPITELNPGGRARALLAGFAGRRVNALILDEPSNHLDEEAVRELVSALGVYTGIVVCVSHDRAFLRALAAHRTFELTPHGGLREVQSVDEYIDRTDDAAKALAEACHKRR